MIRIVLNKRISVDAAPKEPKDEERSDRFAYSSPSELQIDNSQATGKLIMQDDEQDEEAEGQLEGTPKDIHIYLGRKPT